MTTELYCVYDKIAMESAQVFHSKNDAVAARAVAAQLQKYDRPEDFELLHLGSFDHDKAKAQLFEVPEKVHLAVPKQFKKSTEELDG